MPSFTTAMPSTRSISALKPIALALLLLSVALPSLADDKLPMQRVDFQTEVSRVLANDLMRATLTIEANDKDPAALAKTLTDAMNQGLAKAKLYKTVKVSTGNQSNYPVYTRAQKIEGWRGQASLELESTDFKAASALIAKLQSGLQLRNIDFTVAENTRRALEDTLTKEAIGAFRDKADLVTKSWGAKRYELVQMNIGSTGNDYRPPMMMRAMAMKVESDSMPPQEMAGGESRVRITVNGSIELQR